MHIHDSGSKLLDMIDSMEPICTNQFRDIFHLFGNLSPVVRHNARKFKYRKAVGEVGCCELLTTDDRANTLMDRQVVGVVCFLMLWGGCNGHLVGLGNVTTIAGCSAMWFT